MGDSGDKSSLVAALRGSEAVFAVTVPAFSDRTGATPDEFTQGKNMVDAAKEVDIKFFIFSSLPSVTKLSGGKYKNVAHCDEKAAVEEYLKSSGLANASLLTGCFLENYWHYGPLLRKTHTGFDIAVPKFSATDRDAFTWVQRDIPAAVLALLNNYTDPSKNISGKSYPVVNANIPYAELAARTEKALGVEVTFTTAPLTGIPPLDEMYAAHAEYSGFYTATPVPNPDLVALGVKFGTVEEFLESEVKPRFG
ncbi:hypothetical protein B0H17DRAFT_1197792 [Mycena rosella]|uniref:NmrA-like domain-containing protein n=1 Tax=Mycena rosella TaxID=1033263 RepID=A0AAD7DRV3_MYCRO|nr:hypothetical protein B0H17DRAFT_1197792 [Mycena rosella]